MAHEVALNWNASSDSTATNPGTCNIYRIAGPAPAGGSTAGFSKVATGVNASYTAAKPWLDTDVSVGETYTYYVTAVIGGAESAPSDMFQGIIPVAAPTGLTGVAQ